ncbi:MAG TPA: potassium-transporting ATPase subunit KdpC [Bryobacteraceae bacterium]|jgi:K+-transporting ATPase ATPase C chain|nr:potassium-transporting ATPase subunit KdpC [Bryobacteraceae bacterium]
MWRQLLPGFRMTLVLTVLTGLVYPGIVTGLCQMLFPRQANGSLEYKDGKVIGSTLIGQNFTKPEYFQPRPSAAGNGYDGAASGGSNLGPTSQKLMDRVKTSVDKFHKENPNFTDTIPADLLTMSGSGLDPHLSPESTYAQAERVARARGASVQDVRALIAQFTEGRDLGFLGEPRVNVLRINEALDEKFPRK